MRSYLPVFLCALALSLAACDSGGGPDADNPLSDAQANPGEWTWIQVEGAKCRDGSDTGFGIRIQDGAQNLAIYLEGGGACFNGLTCGLNRRSYDRDNFVAASAQFGDSGIFSTTSSNPVGDWNMVYVPYCTGDVHSGSATDAMVPDPSVTTPQQFVGHENIKLYLDAIQPNLDAPDQVLLTGASAGGFGALFNFGTVADRFSSSDMTLLDDSGPIFPDDLVFSPELGQQFSSLFNFPAAFPSSAAFLFESDGIPGIYDYYDDRYPDATFGISSYLQDDTIRFFFGFGQPDGEITGEEYADGLRDLRSTLPDSWVTYFASGEEHTFITRDASYFGTSAGVALNEWVDDLLDGEAGNVDPEILTRPLAAR